MATATVERAKLQDIRSHLVGIDVEYMTVTEYNIWRILEGPMRAAPLICMENTEKIMEQTT